MTFEETYGFFYMNPQNLIEFRGRYKRLGECQGDSVRLREAAPAIEASGVRVCPLVVAEVASHGESWAQRFKLGNNVRSDWYLCEFPITSETENGLKIGRIRLSEALMGSGAERKIPGLPRLYAHPITG